MAPISTVPSPKSASTHFLQEYEWTPGNDIEIGDLEGFLQGNVFLLDPALLKSVIDVAKVVRMELNA